MSQGAPYVNSDIVLIAIGANTPSQAGGALATVQAAISTLRENFAEIFISELYQTPCFPKGSGPDFVNAACRLHSTLAPDEILNILHRIEEDYGRERVKRWGQRTLDLDLIAMNGRILPDISGYNRWLNLPMDAQLIEAPDTLILPHPRVQDRAFVLVPLMDIAPDWRHPVLDQTVAEMLAVLPTSDRAEIRLADVNK